MRQSTDIKKLPKADIHLHAEMQARLERLIARRAGRMPHDWDSQVERAGQLPEGMDRFDLLLGAKSGLGREFEPDQIETLNHDANFVAWLTDAMLDAAEEGTILFEMRFGFGWSLRPGFMSRFREAETAARARHPTFHAEAIITGLWPERVGATEMFEACLRMRDEGLAGIDFIPEPYEREARWTEAYVWAERAAGAGLGVSSHAGELSSANIAGALGAPGITRLGHAVHATDTPDLLQSVVDAGVTVECCLTSNVVLGAVPDLDSHPVRNLVDAGVPVTLNSDDPVRMGTSIGREYELAQGLGFLEQDLLTFTRNTIVASFTTEERKRELLDTLKVASPHAGGPA